MNIHLYNLFIFGLDRTLVEPVPDPAKPDKTFRHGAKDWRFLPDRKLRIAALLAFHKYVGIATNQAGVAYGFLKEKEIGLEVVRTAYELGIRDNMCKMEVTHPGPKAHILYRRESPRRMPNPGMLLELMEQTDTLPGNTIMIGSNWDEHEAAINAHCSFIWAAEFFEDNLELNRVLMRLRRSGYVEKAREVFLFNKQKHLYVFEKPGHMGVYYADSPEEVIEMEEYLSLVEV